MIQNYFHNVKRFLGSLISNARAREGWGKGIYLFSFLKVIGSPAERAMRAGKKKKECGENEFLPACLPAEGGQWGGKRFCNFALAEYQNRKIFVSLIEKNFGGAPLKNVKKIFLFCSPKRSGGGQKRWTGQSAKSSGFCSKKVLTSSSRNHHIELAASLGALPLASAGSFARKSKGFLKSIESFCSLI